MRKFLFGLVTLGLLIAIAIQTGLANPIVQWRVESALVESGVSEERAECMAGRMVDRLSIGQLLNLQSGMAALEGEAEQPQNLGDLIRRIRRVDDGEAIAVVTTSAGLCAIGIG